MLWTGLQDLYDFPDNPWALTGLRDMLRMPLGEDAITAAGLDAKVRMHMARPGSLHAHYMHGRSC